MRDMLGREKALSVEDARQLLGTHLPAKELISLRIPIEQSFGRVLSEQISSPEDLPAFSRSTVDGFAVNSSDTFGATEGMPGYLTVSREILMGERPDFTLTRGRAAKIATGGMLPGGADAVVMLEHVQYADKDLIEVLRPAAPGENVISAGEDIRKDELILSRGTMLRPQDVAALAGAGITSVAVYEKPRVSIISTGDEIIPAGSPAEAGKVREMNAYTLSGLILAQGGIPLRKGIVRDVYEEIRDALGEALRDSDMVLISGGSSVGTKDMTAEIIGSFGPPGVLFHGVALKPGKPTIGAIVGGVPVFGLPGHPAAVAVCFEVFILDVLRVLTGREGTGSSARRTVSALLAKNVSSDGGREEHVRVSLKEEGGELWAVPVLGKSGLIRTLVKAEGTIVIPSHVRGIEKGERVNVLLF
jgi:molybdopterin molybdotransferase